MIDTNEISGFINQTQNTGWLHHTYLQCARRLGILGVHVPYMEVLLTDLPPQPTGIREPRLRTVEETLEPHANVVTLIESALGDVEVEFTGRKAAEHHEQQQQQTQPLGAITEAARDRDSEETANAGSHI